jgi:signal transduction histidine kinase
VPELEVTKLAAAAPAPAVDQRLAVEADRDLLFSAVGNLLQNAFKFTRHGTKVSLTAHASGDRNRIEVQDHCGGLPPGNTADLFLPFKQSGADKSGVGLGLSICRRSVEANNGILSVRDLPGSGCVFAIDLPRRSLPLVSRKRAPCWRHVPG